MSGERSKYLKERKRWLHEHKLCIDCKSQDAFTLVGKMRCAECTEKARIRRSKKKIPKKDYVEMGLCACCGNTKNNEKNVCDKCHQRFFDMSRKARAHHGEGRKTDHDRNPQMPRSEWVKNGFCYLCGEKKQYGIKVCEDCRKRLIKQRIEQKAKGQDALLRSEIDLSCRVHMAKKEWRKKNGQIY